MKIVGLITEYNPFHNGHLYHIQKAKEISGADAAVVVMSGNYVQRGAPAIMPKHLRAEVALEAGADDVVTDPDDGSIDVVCDPAAFDAVSKAFEAAGLTPVSSEITMKPLNEVELKGEDAAKMQKLIDALEDLDDVSNVYTSAVFDEE